MEAFQLALDQDGQQQKNDPNIGFQLFRYCGQNRGMPYEHIKGRKIMT